MKWILRCDDKGYYYEKVDSSSLSFVNGFTKLLEKYRTVLTYSDDLSEFEKVKQDLISTLTALYALYLTGTLSHEDYNHFNEKIRHLLDAVKIVQDTAEDGE